MARFTLKKRTWFRTRTEEILIFQKHQKVQKAEVRVLRYWFKVSIKNWKKVKKDLSDRDRIRTCNLLIRSQTRYPLRHTVMVIDKITFTVYKSHSYNKPYLSICMSMNSWIMISINIKKQGSGSYAKLLFDSHAIPKTYSQRTISVNLIEWAINPLVNHNWNFL